MHCEVIGEPLYRSPESLSWRCRRIIVDPTGLTVGHLPSLASARLSGCPKRPDSKIDCTNPRILALLNSCYYDSDFTGTGESAFQVPKLTGRSNYPQWKDSMEHCLCMEQVAALVLGKELKPNLSADATEFERKIISKRIVNWQIMNSFARGLLRSRMEDSPYQLIKAAGSAADIWSKLEKEYTPKPETLLWKATQRFEKINLADSGSVNAYYYDFTRAVRDLRTISKGHEDLSMPEWYLKMRFLAHLGPEWGSWVDGLLRDYSVTGQGDGKKTLTFDDIVDKTKEEERRRQICAAKDGERMVAAFTEVKGMWRYHFESERSRPAALGKRMSEEDLAGASSSKKRRNRRRLRE